MQATRIQKQNIICKSSLPMSLSFLRATLGYDYGYEYLEGKYYTTIRQPRCRNGG